MRAVAAPQNCGVEDVRILLEDIEADTPDPSRTESAAEACLCFPSVRGLVDRALQSTDLVMPGQAYLVIHRYVKDVGFGFDHAQVDGTNFFVDVQHFRPGLTAVCGPEDASLDLCREEMAHGRYIDDVWIAKVDDDSCDVV